MKEIDEHTMIRMVGTLKTSAAGYDGITPALLKAVLTATPARRMEQRAHGLLSIY